MYNPRFEKDVFKRDVRNNVKTLFRKEVEESNGSRQRYSQRAELGTVKGHRQSQQDRKSTRLNSSHSV